MRGCLLAALLATTSVWATGCANHRVEPPLTVLPDNGRNSEAIARAQQTIANAFPPRYRATQRAIIAVGKKQFTCDGVLSAAPEKGHDLGIVSNLGVVTGLRVKPDGACEMLKITPLFPEDWSRRFVAEDLRRLFVPPTNLKPAGRLADGRLVMHTELDAAGVQTRYLFDAGGERWQELEIRQQNHCVYRASVRNYRAFAGIPGEVPCEFAVETGSHRLELRITEFTVPPEAKP
jgi:hypothetical protein